jgi:hypothetical protein
MTRKLVFGLVGLVALLLAMLIWLRIRPRPENQLPGKFPEELVFVRSADDAVNAGVRFTPPKNSAKPMAIIWVHGWGYWCILQRISDRRRPHLRRNVGSIFSGT